MGRNNTDPPKNVLKLIAETFKSKDAAKARKQAKQPTVAKKIKLRKATPPKNGK